MDYDPGKIRASEKVEKEMQRILSEMHLASPYLQLSSPLTCSTQQFTLLNAGSAKLHFSDIQMDPILPYSSVLGIVETHFTQQRKKDYQLKGFRLFMQEQNTVLNHHGLAIYIAESFRSKVVVLPLSVRMEILCVDVSVSPEFSSKVVLLYRSPSISQGQFLSDLTSMLTYIENQQINISVLMGDFNVDALNQVTSSALIRTMNKFGWKQIGN